MALGATSALGICASANANSGYGNPILKFCSQGPHCDQLLELGHLHRLHAGAPFLGSYGILQESGHITKRYNTR